MKHTTRTNYRLEIRPDTWAWSKAAKADHDSMRRLLTEIEAAIKRHIDNVGDITPRWDTRDECTHCGHEWETLTAEEAASPDYAGSAAGEPLCCDKAVQEFRAERAAVTE